MKKSQLVVMLVLLSSCVYDPTDDKLQIVNPSNEVKWFATANQPDLSEFYNKDTEKTGVGLYYTNHLQKIEPGDTIGNIQFGKEGAWERYIMAGKEGKLRIFTFNKDTLQKYTWKEVVENNRYSKKVEFTVEELDRINWTVPLDK